MGKRYLIPKIEVDNIVYKAYSPNEVKEMFSNWIKSLSIKEKRAFACYRRSVSRYYNINYQLRKNEIPTNAKVISAALCRAYTPKAMVVYRCLDKKEYEFVRDIFDEHSARGNELFFRDFKGTHVGKEIKEHCGHNMLILIPPNAHAAYINDLTIWHRNERELLIERNQAFRLIKKCDIMGKDAFIVMLTEAHQE